MEGDVAMAVGTVLVRVPHELLTHFEERAQRTRRSVEEEIVEALASSARQDEPLPADMSAALTSLDTLSDDELWKTARDSHLSPAAAAHLEEVNHKRQREGLTSDEQLIVEALLQQYERLMVVRAEALARLQWRGRDIAPLLEPRRA
jgi:phage terminase Nu1 subunit (DNA packaging protein)